MQKHLPPCPKNLAWSKFGEDWVLLPKGGREGSKQLDDIDSDGEGDIILQSPLLTHIVLEGETLTGICLRYRCTRREIERLNRSAHINETLGLCDTLIVPNRFKDEADRGRIQFLTKDVIVQILRSMVGVGDVEAKLYLEDAEWNFENAIVKLKEDLAWEQSTLPERKGNILPSNQNKEDSTYTGSDDSIELPSVIKMVQSVGREHLKQD